MSKVKEGEAPFRGTHVMSPAASEPGLERECGFLESEPDQVLSNRQHCVHPRQLDEVDTEQRFGGRIRAGKRRSGRGDRRADDQGLCHRWRRAGGRPKAVVKIQRQNPSKPVHEAQA